MDIEQLKLILETFGNVANDAQVLVIWWLVISKLLPILAWLTVFFGLFKLMTIIIKATVSTVTMEPTIKAWRDALKIGCHGHLSDQEREETIQTINSLIRQHKNK